MNNSEKGLLVFLGIFVAGVAYIAYLEDSNSGMASGVFTLLVTFPIGIAWFLSAVSAGLFVGGQGSKRAATAGSIMQFFSLAILLMEFGFIVSEGNMRELFNSFIPIFVCTFVFFIPQMMRGDGGGKQNP